MPEEDKTMMEVDETGTGTDESSKSSGSAIKKYGMYAGIVIVAVVAAYFVTLKVVKPMLASSGDATEEVSGESEADKAEETHEEKPKEEHGSSEEEDSGHGSGHGSEGAEAVFMIRDIIVNPAGTGGTRFLSASVGFEANDPELSSLMAAREPIIRDALVTILSSQSIPELSDFKQREKLRKLIRLRVQRLLKTEDLGAVYFTEFVLQ